MLHAVSRTAYCDMLYIFYIYCIQLHIDIFIVLMHINVCSTVFAQRTCSSSLPTLSKDERRAMQPDVELQSMWTSYLGMKVADVRVTWLVIPWTYHDVLQKWTLINTSWCTGSIQLMQQTVLLQTLTGWKVLLSLWKAGVWAKTSDTRKRSS